MKKTSEVCVALVALAKQIDQAIANDELELIGAHQSIPSERVCKDECEDWLFWVAVNAVTALSMRAGEINGDMLGDTLEQLKWQVAKAQTCYEAEYKN